MTGLAFVAVAMLAASAGVCVGLSLGRHDIHQRSYWMGWADREQNLDVPVLVDVSDDVKVSPN